MKTKLIVVRDLWQEEPKEKGYTDINYQLIAIDDNGQKIRTIKYL